MNERRALHAFFDKATCDGCERKGRCPVRQPNNARSKEYRLELSPELMARDERWAEQQNEGWRARYRIRCGVEATMSEVKRSHGLGRLRIRRLPQVRIQVALKATACNVKRWLRAARSALLHALLALWSLSAGYDARLGSSALVLR